MASSRRPVLVALVPFAAFGATLAACDSLIGLGNYSTVQCEIDCSAVDSSGNLGDDTGSVLDSTLDVLEAGPFDAGDASDVTVVDAAPEAMPVSDASIDAPPSTLWARWKMPNPDAAIAPDSSKLLPNQMSYQINGDGGLSTVTDLVTNLTWLRAAVSPGNCPPGFHVPTRIQLVSLIDFTQSPITIDTTVFPTVPPDRFLTSSPVIADGGATGQYWTIDFSSGETSTTAVGNLVLCLQDGP
jgi:hypothetical protein